jgi:hypothetical protein
MDELHQIWLVLEDEWAESTGHRRASGGLLAHQ